MKIFVSQHDDIRIGGLVQALKSVVPTTFYWSKKDKPLFDLIEEEEPTIIFYHDGDAADSTIEYAQAEYPGIKFVYMQFLPTLSKAKPSLTLAMDPSLVIDGSLPIDYRTNLIEMEGGVKQGMFTTEVLILTDQVDARIDFHLLTLRALGYQFQTKMYGNNKVNLPNYLGRLRKESYRHALASARVLVAFDSSRYYDACYHNCIPLVFKEKKTTELGAYEFSSLSGLLEKCKVAIEAVNPELSHHASEYTYHHYLIDIFRLLQEETIVDALIQYLEQRKVVAS